MKSLLIIGMLLPVVSFAAVGTRGGGNARVCFTTTEAAKAAKLKPLDRDVYWLAIDSIEVLDLFEARLPRGDMGESMQIMDVKPKETASAFAERVAKRFDRRFPSFSELIREGKSSFTQAQIIWSSEAFGKTDDIDPALHYENKFCSILGLAFQKNVNGQEKLFIDQQLFQHPKHSLLSKNVTFLHEYIYRFARINRMHETSAATREAVGFAITLAPTVESELDVDALGLSIGSISDTFKNSNLLSGSNGYSTVGGAFIDLKNKLQARRDFSTVENMLTDHPKAMSIIKSLHDIVKQNPWIYAYAQLEGPYSTCREETGTVERPRSLNGCNGVLGSSEIYNKLSPKTQVEFRNLRANLAAFVKNDVPAHMKEVVLPVMNKTIAVRLEKLKMSEDEIKEYQELINDKLLESVVYLRQDVTFDYADSFITNRASEFIESSNKKAIADMPL